MKAKQSIILAAALVTGANLLAQSDITTTKSDPYRLQIDDISMELKPLTTLMSAVPGVGSIGLGFEAFVAPRFAVFSNFAVMNANLPHAYDDDVQEFSRLYPRSFTGGSIGLGGRYYGSLFGDSWYGGAKLGVTRVRAKWEYRDEVLSQDVGSLTPGVEGGYRWLWVNNVLVRLGVGASANLRQFDNIETESESASADVVSARKELDKTSKFPVLASVDLGIGYKF
jgi:hypothetical protein